MNVTAVIVTRGDVCLDDIEESLPLDWELIVYDNARGIVEKWPRQGSRLVMDVAQHQPDLSVYGRYAAIEHATGDLIYVQDDDVIVSDPDALVRRWYDAHDREWEHVLGAGLVANMPPEFRHDGYTDSCLVGFGAVFHREAPHIAFGRFAQAYGVDRVLDALARQPDFFRRTCDVVFTTLTPRILVDVPKTNLPWATDETRMYRQPGHIEERTRMLELARKVRDA